MSQLRNTFSKSPVPAWCAALAVLTLIILLTYCSVAQAYPAKVERWRPAVEKSLRIHHIPSWWVEKELHIINGESGGGIGSTPCIGILQYTGSFSWWPHIRRAHYKYHHPYKVTARTWARCPRCAIHRFSHAVRQGSVARHWSATYY
jgi:hypothetical protein